MFIASAPAAPEANIYKFFWFSNFCCLARSFTLLMNFLFMKQTRKLKSEKQRSSSSAKNKSFIGSATGPSF